jgi:hypothetical protein
MFASPTTRPFGSLAHYTREGIERRMRIEQLAALAIESVKRVEDLERRLALATEQGIPARTLRRAKARLRVRSLRASRGRGKRYLARWVLP